MFIPFGQWAPDSPALDGKARVAKNCIGESNYYRSFPALGAVSDALDGRAFGAISFMDGAGTTFNFAGDATKLYKLASNAWSNVSKSGNYTTLTDGRWEFAKFGSKVIATNYLNDVQYFDTSSSSLFADLAGSPPRAKHIAVVNNFVVLANLVDATFGTANNSLRWSGINDPEDWTAAASTQSDGQLLEEGDGGAIQGIVGNSNYGIIVQERAIQRMNYVGSPLVFTFEVLERNRGTPIPNSVVGVGREVFYISDDGFYRFNGVQSIPIGKDRVSKWFWDNFDNTYSERISATIDPLNTIVMWAFTTNGAASGGNPNRIITYNWIADKFTLIELDLEVIFQALTSGLTLEELDNISASIDALPFSLDSSAYTGGKLLAGVIDTDHKLGYFTGDAMTATIETSEVEGAKNKMTEIQQVTPMIEGDGDTATTVKMGKRNNRTDAVSYGSSISLDSFGRAMTRSNGRYHQIETTISGGFEKATGVEVDRITQGGER